MLTDKRPITEADLQAELILKANLVSPTFTSPNIGDAVGSSLVLSGILSVVKSTTGDIASFGANTVADLFKIQYSPNGDGATELFSTHIFGPFILRSASNQHIAVLPHGTGGFGVGTVQPTEKADIVGNIRVRGQILGQASTTALASLRLPHGVAPTTPTNGDFWTTTAGVFSRVNGVTVGPFVAGGSLTVTEVDAAPSVTATTITFPNGSLTDSGGGVVTVDFFANAYATLTDPLVAGKAWNSAGHLVFSSGVASTTGQPFGLLLSLTRAA